MTAIGCHGDYSNRVYGSVNTMWQAISLMPLVFPVARILQKLWGRPPGLRGSPWTRSSQRDQSHLNGKAGQGAVRGPGDRPTIFADRPVMGKTSGIGLSACTTKLH